MAPTIPTLENEIALMVMDVVGARFDVEGESLSRSTRLVEDLHADSLALLELTLALEEAFDIDVATEQIARLRTVEDTIDVVARSLPFAVSRVPFDARLDAPELSRSASSRRSA